MRTFEKLFSKCIGTVHDCYIQQSGSSSCELCLFDASTDLKVEMDINEMKDMVDEDRIFPCPRPENLYKNMIQMYEGVDDEYGSDDES